MKHPRVGNSTNRTRGVLITMALLFSAAFAALSSYMQFPVLADITVLRPKESIDLSRVSVAVKQAQLGTDVRTLFAHVRDGIRYDPHRGVLRGGKGTLLAEAGNSLDKSVLLSELLRKAGHRSRFACGTLDASRAEELLKAALNFKSLASKRKEGVAAGAVPPCPCSEAMYSAMGTNIDRASI